MKNKLMSIQIIRGIACVLVFVSHCGGMIPLKNVGDLGVMGVSIFMVISGFCEYYTKNDISALSGVENLKHKVKKFYPLYFIMLLISIPYAINYSGNPINRLPVYFVLHLFLIQSFVPWPSAALVFNWPSWYLSTSMLFYLLSPFIVRYVKKLKRSFVILLILAVIVFQIFVCTITMSFWAPGKTFSYWLVYINPFFRLGDFLLGIFIAKLVTNPLKGNFRKDIFLGGGSCEHIYYRIALHFGR